MTIRIRQARVDDAAHIADIHVQSWRAAYGNIVPAPVLAAQTVAKQERFWREVLDQGAEGILVATTPVDGLVGFSSFGRCRTDDAAGEIYAIYVRPDCFRMGAGRLLWDAARQQLKAAGFDAVIALVVADNQAARRFYEHAGFRLVPGSDSTFTWEGEVIDDVCYEYRFAAVN